MEREAGSDLNLFFRKVLIVAAVVVALALLWSVRRILLMVFIAGVLATGIAPAVRWVQIRGRHLTRRKIGRGTAVLLVYLPVLLLIGSILALSLPALLQESSELAVALPKQIDDKILGPLSKHMPVTELRKLIQQKPDIEYLPYLRSAATLLSSLVVIAVMIAYMLLDATRLQNVFLLFYAAGERARKKRMMRRVSHRMSAWLSGQLLLAAIIGGATFAALLALRIPYALPLALLAAIGEMVPVIGPILGAIPALIVALFHSSWQFWAVLVISILIQQFENHFLVPRVMGSKVSVSPLSVVLAFMIGATLLGIPGAMMAVPVAAILQVIFEETFISRRERRQHAERPGTLVTNDDEKGRKDKVKVGVETKVKKSGLEIS